MASDHKSLPELRQHASNLLVDLASQVRHDPIESEAHAAQGRAIADLLQDIYNLESKEEERTRNAGY